MTASVLRNPTSSVTRIPYASLGHADHGWLDARHHFSFANYYDPRRMGFGALRVVNDDRIAGGRGFGKHPHSDMEIITFVRSGAISHRDSEGNAGRTEAGDVQVMSAGTGVFHSEENAEAVDTTLYQIWIEPAQTGVAPRWDARQFASAPGEALALLVSGRAEDEGKGALFIHQDAAIWGGRLAKGAKLTQPLKHLGYALVSEGSVMIDGVELQRGDGAEIRAADAVAIEALTEAEVLLIDVPQ